MTGGKGDLIVMMTKKQYKAHCAELGMTQVSAAKFLDISERQSRRLAGGAPIPRVIEMLLRIMVAKKITPEDAIVQFAAKKPPPEGYADRRFAAEE